MNKLDTIVAVGALVGAIALGGFAIGAQAQSAPPGMEGGPGAPDGQPGFGHGMMHRWMQGGPGPEGHGPGHAPGGMEHRPWHHMMGLFYPSEDRALTGAEVQKIAEAFLLWNGNRAWKVTNVAENQDNTVSFAFAAPDGTVIARFAVDRKTGHFHRLG